MPDAGIRWYRHGSPRTLWAAFISVLSVPAADIILAGLTRSVDWAQVGGGAALVAVAAAWICLLRHAGIGGTVGWRR